ncbi:fc-e cd23 receptor, partial [Mytilus galloprovincialis]
LEISMAFIITELNDARLLLANQNKIARAVIDATIYWNKEHLFSACPTSWSHYKDKCFFLSRDNETFADSLVSTNEYSIVCRNGAVFERREITENMLKCLFDVMSLCEVIGRQYGRSASLATVDDAKTQQFLTDLMIKINSIGMYIGLNDLVTEGEFHWISNGKQATYFNWGPSQPNNRGGNENCVAMRVDPGSRYWKPSWIALGDVGGVQIPKSRALNHEIPRCRI